MFRVLSLSLLWITKQTKANSRCSDTTKAFVLENMYGEVCSCATNCCQFTIAFSMFIFLPCSRTSLGLSTAFKHT